jgi:hypothetical protein
MKNPVVFCMCIALLGSCSKKTGDTGQFRQVDQVLWVVGDVDNVIHHWKDLGFDQYADLGTVDAELVTSNRHVSLMMVKACLGGANVTWIQPLEGESVFSDFHKDYGDGAMSLVHRFPDAKSLGKELRRLSALGIKVLEEVKIHIDMEEITYYLMDTRREGKYILAYTYGDADLNFRQGLTADNRNNMRLSQYAFAIRDAAPVSAFWETVGLPAFEISHPELSDTRYYGKLVDHQLIQGWQRQGTIPYEWCIPVKPPIVYEDHINRHGEGIHHLAFDVDDIDVVLDDYRSRGYIVSMGGRWGEEGKPGSGRYEYIDLDAAGGVTMELLWSYKDSK